MYILKHRICCLTQQYQQLLVFSVPALSNLGTYDHRHWYFQMVSSYISETVSVSVGTEFPIEYNIGSSYSGSSLLDLSDCEREL